MKLNVEVNSKSLNKRQEELCGDRLELLRTENCTILILADGMGSGVKANILSTLTAKILGTMLREGSSLVECVETIVQTLPACKNRQVAYSTFTILQIFDSGETYIVEFDNPGSIFIRDHLLMEIPFNEREVAGHLIKECRIYTKPDDLFVLMSDGVIHAGVGRELDFGWGWDNAAAFVQQLDRQQEAAARMPARICQECNKLYQGLVDDDTTVAVVRVVDKKLVKLFTGPPADKEKDLDVVAHLLEEDGKIVVCGGTSANIVSRVLDRPLEVSLDYIDPEIPPMAFMEGIDLVTEGIFTLNKALKLLKEYQRHINEQRIFEALDQKDGGSLLAKMIIEECTDLKLFVGKAINPAYQNPLIPLDFNIRVTLVQQIVEVCRQIGKTVSIVYV